MEMRELAGSVDPHAGDSVKKHRTQIPDFSRKQPSHPEADTLKAPPSAPVHRPAPIVKPKTTSAKSGRRGQ